MYKESKKLVTDKYMAKLCFTVVLSFSNHEVPSICLVILLWTEYLCLPQIHMLEP